MLKSKILLFLCMFFLSGFVRHPLKLSIGDVLIQPRKIFVKLRIFMDDLDLSLTSFSNRRVCFADYQKKEFDKAVLDPFVLYLKSGMRIWVNNREIHGKLLCVKWIKESLDTDSPALTVEIAYTGSGFRASDIIEFKNSLLIDVITEQINVLNIKYSGKEMQTLKFDEHHLNHTLKY